MRKHGLLKILDAVIISGEVHVRKPDPEIFKIALERLGTKAEETLFVGDDPERDIRGATSVDMQTYLFQNGSSLFDIFKNG
ncbi:MAG: HAD family hydrolase [Fibrobacter sp.]|nr:HAD family hydrolase [Fibrobacter sp.]